MALSYIVKEARRAKTEETGSLSLGDAREPCKRGWNRNFHKSGLCIWGTGFLKIEDRGAF